MPQQLMRNLQQNEYFFKQKPGSKLTARVTFITSWPRQAFYMAYFVFQRAFQAVRSLSTRF
jgi:hypothetical protein